MKPIVLIDTMDKHAIVPSLYLLSPHKGNVKVVYSNRAGLLRHGIPRLINPKCSVLWFPETHMDGPEVDELAQGIDRLASGATFGRHDVIVTNSLLVLRAFQMFRAAHPDAISFYYVGWVVKDGVTSHNEYVLSASNDLENLPCPQLYWEMAQSSAYLDMRAK